MRWCLGWLLVLSSGWAFADEDIVGVLERSQAQRLQALPTACVDTPQARRLVDSFDSLLLVVSLTRPVELRLVAGGTVAETLRGHVVVINESLGDLPEAERLFVLAHELGHVALGHWSQMESLFLKWVPGAVTKEHTDAVASLLKEDASGVAHRQEFEADAFAAHLLASLGQSEDDMLAVFSHLGASRDTATHPAALRRMAALRTPSDAGVDVRP